MKKFLLLFTFSLFTIFSVSAQNQQVDEISKSYLFENKANWNLEDTDIMELRKVYDYTSEHNQVTHAYFIQQHNGIDVYHAIYNVNISDEEVIFAGNRMVPNLQEKIIHGTASLTANDAITKASEHLNLSSRAIPEIKEKVRQHHTLYDKGEISHLDIPVELVYAPVQDGKYTLAWDVMIEPVNGTDVWSMRIDAKSGNLLDKKSFTTHCSFPHNFLQSNEDCPVEHQNADQQENFMPLVGDGATYHVVEFPNESPTHGARTLVVDPADPEASPFGWHDLDGVAGSDTTITRGNNVYAFIDRNGDNSVDGDDVDGGEALIFDFEFDQEKEPLDYQDASVTNLFYANNHVHDFAFHYGFTEAAGNFQNTNMTNQGAGFDYVNAMAQFNSGTADPSLNNATFSTPPDGGNGRMRMYVWEGGGANKLLRIEAPVDVAGKIETSTSNGWGAAITAVPVTAEVVFADDGSGQATQGCNTFVNTEEIEGNIAIIDRGTCEFGRKALNAQNAGAIGVIICNFQEGLVNMGAGAVGDQVTIPVVFIQNSDCQRIRVFAGNGLEASLVNESAGTGPNRLAASFDNGVIAHEYGHGISNRLTGGPTFSGCLSNYDHDNNGTFEDGEQMGEGWSDFFTLVTSVKPGDSGETPRGIGTYVSKQEVTGGGIRSFPYSTNMVINPVTYDDIAFLSVPHGVGSVWCSILWDMYWAFADRYGFDEDLVTGTGGNNLAVQLVMDGMKFQTCNPGFEDGRDGILTADLALTGGENQQLIWEVFARRGVGYSVKQGEEMFRHDNSEAFDVNPYVIKELKVAKHVTPVINPGDEIDVELWVVNHKDESVAEVNLSDLVPDEATFMEGTPNRAYEFDGTTLSFDLGSVAPGDTVKVTYKLSSNAQKTSPQLFFDDMESGDFNWDIFFDEGTNFWLLQDFIVNSGTNAWAVEAIDTSSDQGLQFLDPVQLEGENPVLRFAHSYDTEDFFDAGIIQVSKDDGFTWESISPEKMFRGTYDGKIQFSLFAIPNLKGFHGDSDGWRTSYVDLSDYRDEEVRIRWRYGSDGNTSGIGWFVDDVEILNTFSYNSEACVASVEGDQACASAADFGTIVNFDFTIDVDEIETQSYQLGVYPNPATDHITVSITADEAQDADLSLVTASGQIVWNNAISLTESKQTYQIKTDGLPRGFYLLKIRGAQDELVKKVILK